MNAMSACCNWYIADSSRWRNVANILLASPPLHLVHECPHITPWQTEGVYDLLIDAALARGDIAARLSAQRRKAGDTKGASDAFQTALACFRG